MLNEAAAVLHHQSTHPQDPTVTTVLIPAPRNSDVDLVRLMRGDFITSIWQGENIPPRAFDDIAAQYSLQDLAQYRLVCKGAAADTKHYVQKLTIRNADDLRDTVRISPGITELHLSECGEHLTDKHIELLKGFENLQTLNLARCSNITGQHFDVLSQSLILLNLNWCKNVEAENIANIPRALTEIHIVNCPKLGNSCIDLLPPALKKFTCDNYDYITAYGARRLRESLPQCTITGFLGPDLMPTEAELAWRARPKKSLRSVATTLKMLFKKNTNN